MPQALTQTKYPGLGTPPVVSTSGAPPGTENLQYSG